MAAVPKIKIKLVVGNLAETQKLIKQAIKYIREDADCLAECHTSPASGVIEPESTAREIRAKRRWISKAEAWLEADTVIIKPIQVALRAQAKKRKARS